MFLTPEVVEHICTNLNQLVATREFAVIQEAADELSSSDLCPLAQSWTGFAKTPRLSPTVRDVIGMAMANSAINMYFWCIVLLKIMRLYLLFIV